MNHPECLADEILIGNLTLEQFNNCGHSTKRMGIKSYDLSGNIIPYAFGKREVDRSYPVFMKRAEAEEKGLPIDKNVSRLQVDRTAWVQYHDFMGVENSARAANGLSHTDATRRYMITIPTNGKITDDLDTVFRYMNHVDGSECENQIPKDERSLSVGDTVEIIGRTFRVEPIGWADITQTKKVTV